MNIYYAPPTQIHNGFIELLDQEARHASKVMRAREGDRLTVVDGEGGRYKGSIRRITDNTVQLKVEETEKVIPPGPQLYLGMGIIKKRDRLEFAVEKAVELGVSKIGLFRSERTIKENVRMDRLESIAVSAMKQSLRAWLPSVTVFNAPYKLFTGFPEATCLVAHEKISEKEQEDPFNVSNSDSLLLMVGPEGGFSSSEIEGFRKRGARLVSLGRNRLRTETAAVAFLSQFLI